MGCVVLLVATLGIFVGLVMLPTVLSIVNATSIGVGWPALDAVVTLLPFAFFVLIILGALWALIKTGGGS